MTMVIVDPQRAPRVPLEPGRGESIQLVANDKVDVHINVLAPHGPRGRVHRHTHADNVYIVKSGEGELEADGVKHRIVADQVVFIPAGMPHSLSNVSDRELVIYEIYAPAGKAFDFVIEAKP